jgi:hypothetical protein
MRKIERRMAELLMAPVSTFQITADLDHEPTQLRSRMSMEFHLGFLDA